MSNIYAERIANLRKLMAESGVDMYLIPMDDCHNSEYVGEHFKTIKFISGFTGSAARVLVAKDGAWLWTDGRYFLQASTELEGSGIELMKTGEEGVPNLDDFINNRFIKSAAAGKPEVLGFDGKVINAEFAESLNGKKKYDEDLAGKVWTDRPAQEFSEIMLFDEYSGESTTSKLEKIRKTLEKEAKGKPYLHILNSLDDLAWLFNIRANDVEYNPVAYAYAAITPDKTKIYLGKTALTEEAKAYFSNIGVEVADYYDAQNNILGIDESCGERPLLLLDTKRISCDMYLTFKDSGYEVKNVSNPSTDLKAIKNELEITNTKKAQLKDGVAMVRFMKWLKETAGTVKMTECDIADRLLKFREEQEGFIEPSFETIAGFKDNGAIIHYEPERGKDKEVEAEGMLLVDSGGHYYEGTTDTTRTFILGNVTAEEKKCFTIVAVSMLRLMHFDSSKAKEHFNGIEGDGVARALLHEHGYDYNHGTGHGIGHVLNVHEQPPNIGKARPGSVSHKDLLPGMITSDEPGIYVEGKFGIRTENDLLVVEKEVNGKKITAFENLTYVPIDIDGIDKEYMTNEDVLRFNEYNRSIYDALKPFLDAETAEWLDKYTSAI